MLKVGLPITILLGVLSTCALSGPIVTAPGMCKAPPVTYNTDGYTGYLDQCLRKDGYFCCGLAYTDVDDRLCFQVVCQLADDCSSDWRYIETQCPEPETSSYEKTEDAQGYKEG